MITCDVCRTVNEDNARSCTWCGTSLWLSGRAPSGDISRGTVTPEKEQQRQQPAYTPPVYNPSSYNPYAPPAVQPPHARTHPQQRFKCPYCQSNALPFSIQKITEAGWIVFAMMLLFCFPLFWIGLLMKEDQRFCSACRMRLN